MESINKKTLFSLVSDADSTLALIDDTMEALRLWLDDYSNELEDLLAHEDKRDRAMYADLDLITRGRGSEAMLRMIHDSLEHDLVEVNQKINALYAEAKKGEGTEQQN